MITRKSEFNKLVENKLRAKLRMGSQDNWADFTFLDQFILPANMGLTTEGLLLIYNEYEILSFADGITEIFLTMEELNPFSIWGNSNYHYY
ncbi:MAG: RsiV family protein [Bacteroidales bacterium]